jgi:hypothetical protein
MRSTLLLRGLTTGCAVAARSTPESRRAAELAGCYALEYGAWGPEITNGILPSPTDLPTAVHLSAAPSSWSARRRSLGYTVHALSGAQSDKNPFPVWSPVGRDSLWAGVPIQFGGFNLHLAQDGANLRGEVQAYTDQIDVGRASSLRTPVLARRIPCPSS